MALILTNAANKIGPLLNELVSDLDVDKQHTVEEHRYPLQLPVLR